MIPLDSILAIYTLLQQLDLRDLVNGSFELSAGLFILNHCRVLHAHKQVRGVSMLSVAFFTMWGVWNVYYYPSLNQPASFYGGLFVVAANAVYLGMLHAYRHSGLDEHAIYLGADNQ